MSRELNLNGRGCEVVMFSITGAVLGMNGFGIYSESRLEDIQENDIV